MPDVTRQTGGAASLLPRFLGVHAQIANVVGNGRDWRAARACGQRIRRQFLERRADCYRARANPLAEQARADLEAFVAQTPVTLEDGL